MKRGPKPAPTAVKKAKGTRADRIAKAEPKAPAGIPAPPPYLDDAALEEWNRITPLLAETGVLTVLDGASLALYCMAHARLLKATEELKYDSLTTTTERGGDRMNPLLKIVREESLLCHRLLASFGGDPSSRSRLDVQPPEEADELTLFLARRKLKPR